MEIRRSKSIDRFCVVKYKAPTLYVGDGLVQVDTALRFEDHAQKEQEKPKQENVGQDFANDFEDVDDLHARGQEDFELPQGSVHHFEDSSLVEHVQVVVLLVGLDVLHVLENEAN